MAKKATTKTSKTSKAEFITNKLMSSKSAQYDKPIDRTKVTVSLPTEMALALKKLWEEGNADFHGECAAIGLRFEADPIDDAGDASPGVDGFIDYFDELEEQSKELIKLKEISSDEYLKKIAASNSIAAEYLKRKNAEQMDYLMSSAAMNPTLCRLRA